ncbi:MAG: S41 family peptidase [Spirochaetaceae bacterium]|nr:S41 family peptidase [Spirochaetaceae bacterium]
MKLLEKFGKKSLKIYACASSFFVLTVIASQCFAQSGTLSSNAQTSQQYMQQLYSVFDFVERNYVEEVEPKVLFEGAMRGLMDSLGDQFSYYLDAESMTSMNETTVGSFGGVGLSISKEPKSTADKPAYVEVVSAIEDTPGAKAGIMTGDLIININGTDTATISMNEVLSLLRGPVGTEVSFVVRRGEMELPFTITRALIEVQTVKYTMIDKTGYLKILEFTPQTAGRVREALDSFKKAGYQSLVVDLRNNPGGILSSAVEIADMFIDSGVIVSTKSRINRENKAEFASKKNTIVPTGMPVVVLIDHNSASCSEVLSGALKDAKVAYLVGERSYGKGSVQLVVPIPPGDIGVRLTISKYYSPSDANIHGIGIPADLEIQNVDISGEEQQTAFQNLIKDDVIKPYVTSHPNMDEKEIASYAKKLAKKYPLDLCFLRRIVRVQVYRAREMPLYDKDYDKQLTKALEIVNGDNFAALMKNVKTLKEIEAERLAAEEAEKK